ncbi:hypothetical protein [Streptomyces hoynatensis]|uniref:Uncharacterized protein n=1 Tax=Streptomyces hoynatensis TaxID=1141874 RepID=A0A3A9ZF71_9ACTN|nr:hypothetical protein [Streptomyces hoynatensis]RKN47051.1 hypothetical protein D7294_02395 [Streptomyces hoynatensis]
MSVSEELRSARRCLDDLTRCVSRLEQELGTGLDIRRLRSGTDHLRESLDLLAALAAAGPDPTGGRAGQPPTARPVTAADLAAGEMIAVPDAPYDPRLWADADDEGLGARHGPGPA